MELRSIQPMKTLVDEMKSIPDEETENEINTE